VIERAIEVKRRIVAQDPYDMGCRALLNLGHTIGHALETISNYTIAHGLAVATGIVIESRISHAMGLLSRDDLEIIESRFPTAKIFDDPESIFALLKNDKKSRGGRAHFVLLKKIGEPYVQDGLFCHAVPEDIILEVLNAYRMCTC
jgi:3-dehydroquinate synthase